MLRGCSSIISHQGGEGAMMGLTKKAYDAHVVCGAWSGGNCLHIRSKDIYICKISLEALIAALI